MTVSLQEQKGRRVPDGQWFELRDRGELEPGDYGLVTGKGGSEPRRWTLYECPECGHVENEAYWDATDRAQSGMPACPNSYLHGQLDMCCFDVEEVSLAGWHARCPNGVDVNLSRCHPVTVQEDGTVSVSGSILAGDWHGWLCRGVWRQA